MIGGVAYRIECPPVQATGYLIDADTAQQVSQGVREILEDSTGVQDALDALSDIAKTDFELDLLKELLQPPSSFEEWRVGEALAEFHLTEHEGCVFPWPNSRSVRNPMSSTGGVDLIGLVERERAKFVLAEVKTSHQQRWPPSVVTSRSDGVCGQLVGLIAQDARLRAAIRYLMMNGSGRPWMAQVAAAVATYVANKNDVVLFGVLVVLSNDVGHAADWGFASECGVWPVMVVDVEPLGQGVAAG